CGTRSRSTRGRPGCRAPRAAWGRAAWERRRDPPADPAGPRRFPHGRGDRLLPAAEALQYRGVALRPRARPRDPGRDAGPRNGMSESARPRVAVLDYGSGNLRSVVRAVERAGADAELVSDRERALAADGLVVPGVGAYAACMSGLQRVGGPRIIG